MTNDELVNLLTKLSVIFIFKATNGSRDINEIDHRFGELSRTPMEYFPIENPEIKSFENFSYELKFNLCSDYLASNKTLVEQGGLDSLVWLFRLMPFDSNEEVLQEDAEGILTMRSEESVVDWLIRGEVHITSLDQKILNLDLTEFYHTVVLPTGA